MIKSANNSLPQES